METIKTVGIKSLKDNLSAYLREVKRGFRILISDRDQIVAELREPLASDLAYGGDPVLTSWIREAKVRPPMVPKKKLPRSPLKSPEGTARAVLDEDRGE